MNTTVPGSTPEDIVEIARRTVELAQANPQIRATAERTSQELRTALGKTVIVNDEVDSILGAKASPDAKTLMAYIQQRQKELEQQGYNANQAQLIIATKELAEFRKNAEIAGDSAMLEGLRRVHAALISSVGKQPEGPDKGTDIGRFTSGVRRGAAFAMRGRGGRT